VTDYSAVPSTLGFTITTGSFPDTGTLQFDLSSSITSLNTATLPLLSLSSPNYIAFIIDGVRGQSGDLASVGMYSSVYHAWGLEASVQLTDPSGECVGPKGNGDPTNVLVTANYVYGPLDAELNGQVITTTFTTVPEPSSVVMAASGALLVFTVALGRARRASPYQPRSVLTG
jgi:hypothetical protein